MALIKCSECKKKISENAKTCPHCGLNITPTVVSKIKTDQKNGKIAKALIISFLVIFFIYQCSDSDIEQPRVYNKTMTTKYASVNLNVRKTPSISSDIIKVLKPNDAVKTHNKIVNNFTEILSADGSKIGWVSNKYLKNKPLSKEKIDANKTPKYSIIKCDEIKTIKKITISVRLSREVNKNELKKIALKIKKSKPNFKKYWIFYFLPGHTTQYGAWATSHFKPELEIRILGASNESFEEMEKTKVSGNILNLWLENDAIQPKIIYLVKEDNKLFIKTVYAKSGISNATVIVEKVVKSAINGRTEYNPNNIHGEYYIVEENGNLGFYGPEGKYSEARKIEE